ncbi:MAG: hypothetical protein HN348_24035, partial [Proteobacteria bacterium]|nr:hypothetical protein [Pseudomonadota bacterium]
MVDAAPGKSGSNDNFVGAFHDVLNIVLTQAQDNRIEDLESSWGNKGLLIENGSQNNTITNVLLHLNTTTNLRLVDAHENRILNLRVANTDSKPIELEHATGNIFDQVTIANNGHFWSHPTYGSSSARSEAIRVEESRNNVFSRLNLIAVWEGVDLWTASNNVVSHVTVLGSGEANSNALVSSRSAEDTWHNITTVLATTGFKLDGDTTDEQVVDLVATDHANYGVALHKNAVNSFFSGTLIVGNNRYIDCVDQIPRAWEMGCDNANHFTATPLVIDASAVGSFVGLVDDSTNTSATNGVADYDNITDWTDFDSQYRGWGQLPLYQVQYNFSDGAFPTDITNDATIPWDIADNPPYAFGSGSDPWTIHVELTEQNTESCFSFSGEMLDGKLRFNKVRSNTPSNSYDKLAVIVDGIEDEFNHSTSTSWVLYREPIDPGPHTIEICLRKFSDSTYPTDIWIDSIGIEPYPHCDRWQTCAI